MDGDIRAYTSSRCRRFELYVNRDQLVVPHPVPCRTMVRCQPRVGYEYNVLTLQLIQSPRTTPWAYGHAYPVEFSIRSQDGAANIATSTAACEPSSGVDAWFYVHSVENPAWSHAQRDFKLLRVGDDEEF